MESFILLNDGTCKLVVVDEVFKFAIVDELINDDDVARLVVCDVVWYNIVTAKRNSLFAARLTVDRK